MLIAIALFVGLPFFISHLLRNRIPFEALRGLIEGVIRVALFVCYVKLISMVDDIKRVFMYHGAEHKAINCLENQLELTVENVRKQSKVHRRCGTSYLLVVMLVSILFFLFIVVDDLFLRIGLRILLVPVIAGVAYEFIRYAGRSNTQVMRILSKPGLWLQSLTTKEPDDDMIEVAIASVNEVFDWKAFLAESTVEQEKKQEEKQEKKQDKKLEKKQEKEQEKKQDKKPEKEQEKEQDKELEEESEDIMQIVDLEDEDEDEILKALDRYFEAPEREL
jgi:uncharacterized protein YqhQ